MFFTVAPARIRSNSLPRTPYLRRTHDEIDCVSLHSPPAYLPLRGRHPEPARCTIKDSDEDEGVIRTIRAAQLAVLRAAPIRDPRIYTVHPPRASPTGARSALTRPHPRAPPVPHPRIQHTPVRLTCTILVLTTPTSPPRTRIIHFNSCPTATHTHTYAHAPHAQPTAPSPTPLHYPAPAPAPADRGDAMQYDTMWRDAMTWGVLASIATRLGTARASTDTRCVSAARLLRSGRPPPAPRCAPLPALDIQPLAPSPALIFSPASRRAPHPAPHARRPMLYAHVLA
ncbi:hypothetical protein B0H11DRAFT_2268611 [Mycena galericulata]|nr:hypothetical protein B0H11DRAFT_2268611 [Mycena galericulata]